MLKINDVCKSYSTNHLVLDKFTLTLEPSGVFGLLGPNGSGKSTLIKIITGVYPADEGDVVIDRFSIRKDPIKAKKKLGYVPDVSNTFLNLKGYEYLELLKSINLYFNYLFFDINNWMESHCNIFIFKR